MPRWKGLARCIEQPEARLKTDHRDQTEHRERIVLEQETILSTMMYAVAPVWFVVKAISVTTFVWRGKVVTIFGRKPWWWIKLSAAL